MWRKGSPFALLVQTGTTTVEKSMELCQKIKDDKRHNKPILGCFYILVIVNNAAVNIGVLFHISASGFFGYIPTSGIAGS